MKNALPEVLLDRELLVIATDHSLSTLLEGANPQLCAAAIAWVL